MRALNSGIILFVEYPLWKRISDILGAICGLAIIIPFIPIIALAIQIEGRGGVFVALDRISEGRVVKIYKFRTMVPGARDMKRNLEYLNERKDGPFFKIRHDPRVTRVGRMLRRFRIDEFPQFVNVLRGELALVGPRPHEPEETASYPEEYRSVLMARAGITGMSQVNGASSLPFIDELKLDKQYIEDINPALDLKIAVKTIVVLFFDPTAV